MASNKPLSIELTGKLKAVKIKPDCGELDTAEMNVLAADYKRIALMVSEEESLDVTVREVGINETLVKTTGKIKTATITADGCKLKYDGLQFTTQQYADLAGIVQGETSVEFSICPVQSELAFNDE